MPASIGCALVDGEVWLFAEPDEIERADYFPLRVPAHARAGKSKGGQFRSASSAVLAAIENWMNAADSPDDPFEGRDKSGRLEFSTRALETAAGQLGIPPIPQRTEPKTGRRIDRRPALKLALLEAARRQVRAQRDENVDKAFDHGGSRYSPPPGTRRNVRARDGSSLGYMVFEREGGDRGDTWAAYRDDGVLLGHFETIPEAHAALQRKGAIPDGTRLRFDGDAFAVRKDGAWEVHVPAVVQPGDSPLLPDEPGRVVGTADTPEAAQALAAREMARRRPRPRALPRPAAPTQDLTGTPRLSDDPAVRAVQVENRIRQAYARAPKLPAGGVRLDDLRNELGESTPRPEIDAALIRMGRQPRVSLLPNENRKEFTLDPRGPAWREAAVTIGPVDYHYLLIEDGGGLKPLPTAPPPPARPRKPLAIKSAPGRPLSQRERAAEAVLNGRVSADTAKRLLGGQTPEQILQERNQTPRDRAYDRLTPPQKAAVDALAPNQANVYFGRRLEGDKVTHAAAMKSLPAPVWPAEPEGSRIQYAARLSSASEGRAPRGTILSREGHTATVRWDETSRTETGVPLGDLKDLPAPAPLPAAGEAYLRKAADAPTGVPFGGREMPTLRRRGLVELHHVDTDANGRAVRYMVLTDAGRDYLDERDAQIAREAAKPAGAGLEAAASSLSTERVQRVESDGRKAAAGFAADLEENIAKGASDRALGVLVQSRLRRYHVGQPAPAGDPGAPFARLLSDLASDVDTGDREGTLRRLRARMAAAGMEPVDRAGQTVHYDPEVHDPMARMSPGAPAVVVRPGYVWTSPTGERMTVTRPLVQESPTAETGLEAKTLPELRAMLRQRGLPTSGTKAQLLERLRG